MMLTETLILSKIKPGYVLGALLVMVQIVTIDNPVNPRSQREKEEAIQNLSKDLISLLALLFVAASMPTKIHKARLRAELRRLD